MQSQKHEDLEAKALKDGEEALSPVKPSKSLNEKNKQQPITDAIHLEKKIVEEPMEEDGTNWEDIAENEDIEIGRLLSFQQPDSKFLKMLTII